MHIYIELEKNNLGDLHSLDISNLYKNNIFIFIYILKLL